jgi:anti-anti-sigma regulatory factor
MFATPPKSSLCRLPQTSYVSQTTHFQCNGTANASTSEQSENRLQGGTHVFDVHQEKIGDVSVIICKGRMIGSEAAFKLRDEVRRQGDARIVLLNLSELVFLGGDVLGMLVVLQVWTRGLGIQFKLFDPPPGMVQNLRRLRSTAEFEIASIDDVLSLLHWSGPRNDFIESVLKAPGFHAA